MIVKMYVERVNKLTRAGMTLEAALGTVPMLWRSAVAVRVAEAQA